MENRNFLIDAQWNTIHYPEMPTGFGILIIGDERHFVDESKCFWTQNEGKLAIINHFKNTGYTIFSSNLYGRNWGSEEAVELAQRLYHQVIRSEILNNKIHIVAEGMGALVALKLMEKMKGQLRSVVLLNPILSLKSHIEQEKEYKFFYKKLMRELSIAHHTDQETLEKEFQNSQFEVNLDFDVPIKIITVMSGGKSYTQSKQMQQVLVDTEINPIYIVPEKKQQLSHMMIRFFNKYEKDL
jgi:pimeloyl-ACP methyl ester carboxylesterase